MTSFRFSLITTLCAVVLTACSSSSGGGEANSTLFITQDPYKSVQNVSKDATANQGSTSNTGSVSGTKPEVNKVELPNVPNRSEAISNQDSTNNTETTSETKPEVNKAESPNVSSRLNIFNDDIFVASANPTMMSGGILKIQADGKTENRSLYNFRSEELNELMVDGVHIRLFNVNDLLNANGLDDFKTLTNSDVVEGKKGDVSGYAGGIGSIFHYYGFYNTRFGVYTSEHQDHLFVQGYVTPLTESVKSRNGDIGPMPQAGRYTYRTGQAIYGKEGQYGKLAASAVADFDTKTLNVKLSGATDLAFSATIEGNGFKGDSNGIQSKGLFYGDRADEVGGIFYQTEGDEKGKGGVFGVRNPRRETQ